ncbi:MAG: TPM domain-containing protein [Terriglobia bacterium]
MACRSYTCASSKPALARLTSVKPLAILVIALACAAPAAWAEKVSNLKPHGYVNDFAQVLSAGAVSQLSALCQEVDARAHAQIAVVTVHSLDGEPIDMFANDLFTQWGVGAKGTDRGVLILLAVQDRRYRIEVGYGLEPVLTDGLVGRFGREVVPALKAGNYDGAIGQLVHDVARVIAQSSGIKLASNVGDVLPSEQAARGFDPTPYLPLVILLGIVAFGLLSSFGSGFRGGPGSHWRRGGWGWGGPWLGGGFGGLGGSGGGGFGGFGGGMSGGGGASGGW